MMKQKVFLLSFLRNFQKTKLEFKKFEQKLEKTMTTHKRTNHVEIVETILFDDLSFKQFFDTRFFFYFFLPDWKNNQKFKIKQDVNG